MEPAANRVIGKGPCAHRLATMASLFSSPSAANNGAVRDALYQPALASDILRDVLELSSPSFIVHPERLGAARHWDAVEARLHHRKLGPALDLSSAVFETARLMAAANGSQILISEASRAAIGDRVPSATVLRDLGWLHLRDVPQPERAFEAISTDETLHVARERALLAFLFTDIVASTAVAVELGDQRWRALIDIHNRLVREILPRFRGREVRSTGDGVFAVFDAPSRAVEYARTLMDRLRPLGIEIRAGIHVGECEVVGEAFEGVAVHIAARVAALATGSEILVSSPVKDVVAGTAIAFDDHGSHVFKGLPGEWHLYSVAMR